MKTDNDMLLDSYTRAETHPLYVYDYSERCMMVVNRDSHKEYLVDTNHEDRIVTDCDCPHRLYRCRDKNIPCKHIVAVANYLHYDIG